MSANMTAPSGDTAQANSSRIALGYILIAVISYALIPAAIEYIGGEKLPFFFVAAWRLGVAVGCVGILIVFYLPLWLNRYNWGRFKYYLDTSETKAVDWRFPVINLHLRVDELRIPLLKWKIPGDFIDWRVLLTILGNCEYALFAWALQYIDITMATIVFQSWPIFFLILSALLLRENIRHLHNGKTALSLFLLVSLSVIGFAFIVFSQSGEIGHLGNVSSLITGVVLVAGAMALGNLKAFGIDWGRRLGNQLSGDLTGLGSSPVMFFVLVSFLISSFGAAAVGLIVGLGRSETWDMEILGMAFLGGLIVNSTAGIMWRKANMADDDIGFNALGYAIPVVAILFLLLFGMAGVSRVDYLILGVTAIVVANLLINFEAEVRWSFEALILALGGCGTLVYFREDLFKWVGLGDGWAWSGDGYFGSVGLSATVFTLLLAFRVARLVTRTSDEENRTFSILRKLDSLARRGVIDGEARQCIMVIDESNNQAVLKEYYLKTRKYIADATPGDDTDRQRLNEAEAELDTLVRSKQVSPVLGEIFALLVFAGITIFLTIFTRPVEPEAWTRLLIDLFAMLVSSVIIFLMIYSLDLDRERDAHKLEKTAGAETDEYLLVFPDTERRLFDQWLSVAVGVIIILVYAGLMAHKWVGWFGGTPPAA
ncbi:MAG: hypothetical protein F4X27_12090 [Chloroflexi bacterium]|nr:hypothetical protein [Chloroflexota bacterium]